MKNFKTLGYYLMLTFCSLNGYTHSMSYNPQALTILAGHVAGKYCSTINDLPIPEECHKFLGLVKLEGLEKIGYTGAPQERLLDNIIYLNISSFEFNKNVSFESLIKAKEEKGLKFILGVVTTQKKGIYKRSYYDAQDLRNALGKTGYDFKEYDDYKPKKISEQAFIIDIRYYIIDSVQSINSEFLGSNLDDCYNNEKMDFFDFLFRAHQGDPDAQCCLAEIYYEEDNIAQAKNYFLLAARQNYNMEANKIAKEFLSKIGV